MCFFLCIFFGDSADVCEIEESLIKNVTQTLEYFLIAFFFLSHTKGSIRTRGDIDYETKRTYQIVVKANDNGAAPRKSSTTTVNINVRDLNDNVPTFTAPLLRVTEDYGLNKTIKTLTGK